MDGLGATIKTDNKETILDFIHFYGESKKIETRVFQKIPTCREIFQPFSEINFCANNRNRCNIRKSLVQNLHNNNEPVFLGCNASLLVWVIPVWQNNTLKGYIVCGPETVEKPAEQKEVVTEIHEKRQADAKQLFNILEEFLKGNSFYYGFFKDMIQPKENRNTPIFHLEYEQVSKVVGDYIGKGPEQGKKALNDILTDIFLSTSCPSPQYKYRIIELFVMLFYVSKLKIEDLERLVGLYGELLNSNEYDSLCLITLKLCNYFSDKINKQKNNLGHPVVNEVVRYINSNYHQDISLSNISAALYFTPSYISRLFRKYLGSTFGQYLREFRINKAKELLLTTDLSIQEIADQVGYTDASHFSKTFKNLENCSPTQYRKLNKRRCLT